MSGGHFGNYDYYKVSQFADELEEEILNNGKEDEYGYAKNYSQETLEYLGEQVHYLHKLADIMRHIDYLYSGDHGEDTFMERVKEVESKYGSW